MKSLAPARLVRLPRSALVRLRLGLSSLWLGRNLAVRGDGATIEPGVSIVGAGRIRLGSRARVLADATLWATDRGLIEIGARTYIGSHTWIVANASIRIGADVLIAPFCYIQDTDHGFSDPTIPINRQESQSSEIIIEDDVWLGAHTIVTRGVRIGQGAVIGAGSVVTRDIPERMVAAGVPARPIRPREGPADVGDSRGDGRTELGPADDAATGSSAVQRTAHGVDEARGLD